MIKRYGLAPMVVLVSICVAATGCHPRIQSIDSFNSAVTPQEPTPNAKGDPYMNGGIAEGTGGLKSQSKYHSDSKLNPGADPTDPSNLDNGGGKSSTGSATAPKPAR